MRGGKDVDLPVVISETPPRGRMTGLPAPQGGAVVPQPLPPALPAPGRTTDGGALAGVSVVDLTPALIARHRLPENIEGVLVTEVTRLSPAAARLQPGDAIEQINDTPVTNREEFNAAAAALGADEPAMLLLARGRVRSFEVVAP
jgi:membrane-associated protease RseP (regulator of RpoE activity)